jgi:iron-sulfur cluster assembly accessory protein
VDDLLKPPEPEAAAMVNISATPEAIAELKRTLHIFNRGCEDYDNVPSLAKYVRLGVRGGGCSGYEYSFAMELGTPAGTDFVVEQDGVRFVVDQVSAVFLDGTLVTWAPFMGFKFVNPNVSNHCGCGKSFSN